MVEATSPSTSDPHCDFDRVEVRDVSRHYGRRRALGRVSFDCRAGSVVGLFGPNGAGKSTLLGVLATSLGVSSGVVRYGGKTAGEWGDRLRGRIGVLGHDLFLYGDLTVRENLQFFGRLYGVPQLESRIDHALQEARLEVRANDRAGRLSRGLRQRLALERALVHSPRLVLLDEPFTGLDDDSAGHLVRRLQTLRAGGAVIVMATHDFDTAEPIVDHAMCLTDGRMREVPPGAGSLRERYRVALREGVS